MKVAAQETPAENTPQDTPRNPAAQPPTPPRTDRLPNRRGWLSAVSWRVASGGSRIQALLADPEMLPLLAAEPRLLRLLRLLCAMLGVILHPAVAALDPLPPRPPRAPRPPRPKRWRPPSRRSDMLFMVRMGKPLVRY